MSLTSTFITAYGTTTLVINDGGVAQTFDVSSIGQLSYDFDQTPDSVSIDRVQALYSQINISASNFNMAGTDLWERLRTATLTEDAPCLLTVGGEAFAFRLRNNDLSFNERSRMIDMTLIPLVIEGVTAGQVFDALEAQGKMRTTSVGFFGATTTPSRPTKVYPPLRSSFVKDFIQQAMSLVFGNAYDNIYLSAKANLGSDYAEDIYGEVASNQTGFVMLDMPGFQITPTSIFGGTPIFGGSEEGAKQLVATGTVSYVVPTQVIPNEIQVDGTSTNFVGDVRVGDIVFVNEVRLGIALQPLVNNVLFVNTSPIARKGDFPLQVTGGKLTLLRPIFPNDIPALNHLKDLAGIEGAFFGTGFSRNFYVNRIRTSDAPIVTLDYTKVTDFKPDTFNLSLGSSFVAQRADGRRNGPELMGQWPLPVGPDQSSINYSGIPNLREFESITTGNPNGAKGLQIGLAPGYPALNKAKRTSIMDGRTPFVVNDDLLENSLTRTGLTSYFQAINNTTNGIVVEFTLLGAFTLKPWELFQFDTLAPEKYRNRQYRITSISYDIINDTATVRGYQVSELTTPVFTGGLSSVAGINAEFGTGLLPVGLKNATQASIADNDARVASAVFRTAQSLSGSITSFFVAPYGTPTQSVIDDGYIGFEGYSIKIVNPYTLQTLDAVLSTDLLVGAQRINVNATTTDDFFPAGSYIYLSQEQVLSGIIAGELSQRLFAQATSIGTLLANVSGPVNSLSVLLNTRVRKGQDLQVKGSFGIDGSPNPTYYFASRENYDAGVRTMDIRDEDNNAVFVLAKAGTEIIGNPVSTQAELNISPGEIAFGVDAEYAQISLGLTSAVILAGSPITTIPIDKLRSNLFSGTQVVLSSWQGSQRVVLNGDATASESPVNLSVNTFTPDFDYNVGSEVFEPSFSQSSRITVNSNSIVLKVDTNGNIAAISLLGNPDLGSNITIQADQITVAGQTTFLSALSAEGFPTTTDVNVTIRSGTAPTERPDTTPLLAGDIWINTGTGQGNLPHSYDGTTPYNVNGWIRMYTVIDGGDLTTGSITANKIQAGAITANEIASATITGDKIATGTITADKINVDGMISLSAGGIIKSTTFTAGSDGWQIESDGTAEFNDVTVRGTLSTTTVRETITVGASAVTGDIRSFGYTAGTSGWQIESDGSAEFNNVTVRGEIQSSTGKIANWKINGTALFFDEDSATLSIDSNKTGRTLTGQSGSFDTAGLFLDTDNYFLLVTQGDFSTLDAYVAFRIGGNSSYILVGGSGNVTIVPPSSASGLPTNSLYVEQGTAKVAGSSGFNIPNVTITNIGTADSPYTVLATDTHIAVDTGSSTITINLPVGTAGRVVTIFDTGSGNTITINRASTDTINGATSTTLTTAHQSVTLLFNSGNWTKI
jgi:hypothetical protein